MPDDWLDANPCRLIYNIYIFVSPELTNKGWGGRGSGEPVTLFSSTAKACLTSIVIVLFSMNLVSYKHPRVFILPFPNLDPCVIPARPNTHVPLPLPMHLSAWRGGKSPLSGTTYIEYRSWCLVFQVEFRADVGFCHKNDYIFMKVM